MLFNDQSGVYIAVRKQTEIAENKQETRKDYLFTD